MKDAHEHTAETGLNEVENVCAHDWERFDWKGEWFKGQPAIFCLRCKRVEVLNDSNLWHVLYPGEGVTGRVILTYAGKSLFIGKPNSSPGPGVPITRGEWYHVTIHFRDEEEGFSVAGVDVDKCKGSAAHAPSREDALL